MTHQKDGGKDAFRMMRNPQIRVRLVEDNEDDHFLTRDVIQSSDRASYEIVWCETFDKALDGPGEQ